MFFSGEWNGEKEEQHWQIKGGLGSIVPLVDVGSLRLKGKEEVGKTSFRGLTMKKFKKECLTQFSTRSWVEHDLPNKFSWNLLNLCFPLVIWHWRYLPDCCLLWRQNECALPQVCILLDFESKIFFQQWFMLIHSNIIAWSKTVIGRASWLLS